MNVSIFRALLAIVAVVCGVVSIEPTGAVNAQQRPLTFPCRILSITGIGQTATVTINLLDRSPSGFTSGQGSGETISVKANQLTAISGFKAGASCSVGVTTAAKAVTGVQFGTFIRTGTEGPPFGFTATSPASPDPSPYPSLPATTAGIPAYCGGTDSLGNSITTARHVDYIKAYNYFGLDLTTSRFNTDPFDDDQRFLFGGTTEYFGREDVLLCWQYAHGVTPWLNIGMGGVSYNESATGFAPKEHSQYDTPLQYAGSCSLQAQHFVKFGWHNYSTPDNEVNSFYFGVNGIFGGAPSIPTIHPTTGGTLTVGTAYAYRVSAMIPVNGSGSFESQAGAESTAVTMPAGSASNTVLFGPLNTATAYKIYGRTAGSEQLLATIAASSLTPNSQGYLSWIDTGAVAPSGSLPTPTTATKVAGVEAQIAGFMTPCYSAIHAADPSAIVYGFELNEDGGLNPSAAQFIHDERVLYGNGPGTGYDGISTHMTLRYPYPAAGTPCYPNPGGDYTIACLDDLEAAAGQIVPLEIGEYTVTWPLYVPDAPTAGLAVLDALPRLMNYPYMRNINFADVDECAPYVNTGFANGCLIDLFNNPTPMWFAAATFTIPLAQPTALPTVIALSTPTPTPTASPSPAPSPTIASNNGSFFPPVTLSTAPANGSLLLGFDSSSFGQGTVASPGATMTDSNSLNYPMIDTIGQPSNGSSVVAFLGTVSGSPTGSVAFTSGVNSAIVYNVAGVSASAAIVAHTFTASSGSTVTLSIPGTFPAGSKVFVYSLGGAPTYALSTGDAITIGTNSAGNDSGFFTTTSATTSLVLTETVASGTAVSLDVVAFP